MNNLIDFFPQAVYYCNCLQQVIDNCSKPCSLQYICDRINDSNGPLMYCVKCGDQYKNVVITCEKHLTMGPLAVTIHKNNVTVIETQKQYCLSCIKNYLQQRYYIFNCQNFKHF